ncbi:MAG: thiamine pyrophosphate-requiring protein [Candidatus Bathyarchaeota archaeon]|nr:thiamine pyrophosphate-requiring protein [Candidatus Bathyarchaeota archaeon]
MKGAEVEAKILKAEGVEFVALFPDQMLANALAEEEIRVIMPRQERVGINMADGYSRISNGRKIGVCSMQPEAGIQNSFAGVAQAYADSSPILVLPEGTVRRNYRTFPMVDVYTGFRGVTRWIETIWSAEMIPELMRRSFTFLRSGRVGPVLLDLPSDVAEEEMDDAKFSYAPVKGWRMGPDPRDVEVAVRAIMAADSPVIVAGQGILYAEAWDELREFAELLQVPVMTTICGKSAFPENNPLALGLAASFHTEMASRFLGKADLVFAAGTSLTDYFVGFPLPIPAGAKIIQLTNDVYDINKHHAVDYAVMGDAKLVLRAMIDEAERRGVKKKRDKPAREIADVKGEWMKKWMPKLESDEVPINPYRFLWDLMHTIDRENSIVTAEAGISRNSFAVFWEATAPRSYVGWGHTTTLGFSLGMAMGAKLAAPEKLAVNVMGDGGFGMVGMDFETSIREEIPILTIVSNNSTLSTIDLYPAAHRRYSLGRMTGNYADLAESLGGYGERVERPDEIAPAIKRAVKSVRSGKSALLEFITRLETARPP